MQVRQWQKHTNVLLLVKRSGRILKHELKAVKEEIKTELGPNYSLMVEFLAVLALSVTFQIYNDNISLIN